MHAACGGNVPFFLSKEELCYDATEMIKAAASGYSRGTAPRGYQRATRADQDFRLFESVAP